ncbi:MAG: hypothetical protein R6U89_10005 [Dehalococcoidia bacterium]
METFADIKELVNDPGFQEQRYKTNSQLDVSTIDQPVVGLIRDILNLKSCYTLQSCYGHFLYSEKMDIHNVEPLPAERINGEIKYRIAYIAFCVENSEEGRGMLEDLKRITDIDPHYVQCGSAEWFWMNRVNTYQLQVEPYRYRNFDTAVVEYDEAIYIERVRGEFVSGIHQLVKDKIYHGK